MQLSKLANYADHRVNLSIKFVTLCMIYILIKLISSYFKY